MGKKITQLATITEVADDDLIVGVDVSDTSGSENGTNKKFTKATLLGGLAPLNPQLTGWNPDTETWVYHNVDDPTGYIKIEDKDVSANYSVGYRIMFTNGGNVIKGILTAVAYSNPDTILTFLHEINPANNQALYLLANSAITNNYYSTHKAPLGFPLDTRKWRIRVINTSNASQANPTANQWYNLGSISINVPIGLWKLSYVTSHEIVKSGALNVGIIISTLSTTNNGESDPEFSLSGYLGGASGTLVYWTPIYKEKIISLASKTTYYLNCKSVDGTGGTINHRGDYGATVLNALCAYL